ncbi:MAG: ribose 5-phosphate isomerase B [Gemmataceae bacterium]
MHVALGADHAGFELKERVKAALREYGFPIEDVGTFSRDPVDYPDIAAKVSEMVLAGKADRGVLLCGSGVGASVAANKFPGIRAAICHDIYSAHQGVEHDDMNVIVLGARVIGDEVAAELCRAFLDAKFSGEDRHIRRLGKIRTIEQRHQK